MTFYIAIIDYGLGNLKSISKLLNHLNVKNKITAEDNEILDADGIILPGVGAFRDAMSNLKDRCLIPILRKSISQKKPLFGICLGMQLLFSKSFEMGETRGLDFINGEVLLFDKSKVDKVPQIGWNSVNFTKINNYLINNIASSSYFYFVHSYYCVPENKELILGKTKYGEIEFCSMICKDNIIATQFHPEKSSKDGIEIYRNFINYCKR
ncbi:MAG: imidazole glycerol phosphate synthase subunit HisH [Candidatus Lokiarchaeota archaeon]|nr:imidazole glycerol phosphate synthase subunit HisH [Candidatus Lokiarchaeota archaeon]MBD3202175.1 imidazole glycerol phosphate synthase subunit HisH [Candidatus Lokiarchaeota archaeon]